MVGATFATLRDFRILYEAEYGFVWSAVRRLGVPGPAAEDAVQDTFIVAYRKRESFEAGPTRPWLYGIARGVASNYRRSAKRVARKHQALSSAMMMGEGARHSSPHESVQALDRFLGGLTAGDRELFVLSEVEGMTGPELAAALQSQPRTIYRRLAQLRANFETQAIDEGSLKPRRPRASAASWVALLPALRTASVGWMGLTAGATKLVAVVLGASAVAGIGVLTATPDPAPSTARAAVAPLSVAPPPPAAPIAAVPIPLRTIGAVATPAPSVSEPTRRAPTSSSPEAPEAPPETKPANALARENALLRRAAEAAAAGRFGEALDATKEHASEFPRSPMADLRQALRIESLCGLGKRRQARGEAHAFVTANPDAPMVDRINRACVSEMPESGQ